MNAKLARVALFSLLLAVPLTAAPLGSSPLNEEGLTLDLVSVERKGTVITVKWSVRNDGEKAKYVDLDLAGSGATSYLVDEESGTKYFALTDKAGYLLATEHEYEGIWEQIEPGKSKRFWAKFPAPPPAVKSINVLFTGAEPMEGIAITDK